MLRMLLPRAGVWASPVTRTAVPPLPTASPCFARWFASDSKKGRGKDDKVVFKQPTQHIRNGHGAKDRPLPSVARAAAVLERQKAAMAARKAAGGDDGAITDDEFLSGLLEMAKSLPKPPSDAPPLLPAAERETLDQLEDAHLTREVVPLIAAPDDVRPHMRVATEHFDVDAATSDSDAEQPAIPPGLAPDAAGVDAWRKHGGTRPRDELERAPGAAFASQLRAGPKAAPAPGTIVAGVPGVRGQAAVPLVVEPQPRVSASAARAAAAEAAAEETRARTGLDLRVTDAGEDAAAVAGGGAFVVPDPEDLRLAGADVSSGIPPLDAFAAADLEPATPIGTARPSMTRRPDLYYVPLGHTSAAAEADARLSEEAAALLASTKARRPPSSADAERLFANDDDSDYGGDPLDPRLQHDPRIQALQWQRLRGLPPMDDEAEELLEIGVDEDTGHRLSGPFGSDVLDISPAVLHELANPFEDAQPDTGDLYPPAKTIREAAMTPNERLIDESRKSLRKLIEEPLPILNRPIWPLYSYVACMDQVTQVLAGGMAQSTRVMVVVGNGMGGAGFGVGKHLEAFMATKLALANAQRDMIHVSTHKGQLYHDLIGKRHQLYVIVRTRPATAEFCHAAPIIQDVFELMGITHASAKIVGSRRRSPYQVMQALFDAFNHHTPPEQEAATRGLRMLWMGADRLNPRMVYPQQPTGPRYPSANQRLVVGRRRA